MPNASPEMIRDPKRLAALRSLLLLDTPADPAFDRLTLLASRLLKSPISVFTLIDENRQFLKSQVGVSDRWATRREMPLEYSYCQHIIATQQPLIVEDARTHPLLHDNLATIEDGVVAYAGIPLVTPEGDILGAFCVVDKQPRVWTDEEISILTELSRLVMTEIELHIELLRRRSIEDALRKSEQHLHAVITSAPLILYVADQNGIVLMSEGRGLEAVGVAPNSIVGQSIFDIYANQPEITSAVQQALKGETAVVITEQQTQVGLLYYEARISPYYDSLGNIIGAIGVANDVTDQMHAEQTLEDSIERLTLLRRVDVELSESLDLESVLTIAMDTAQRATGANHGAIALLDGDQLRTVHTIGAYDTGVCFDLDKGVVGRALRTQQPQLVLDVTSDPDYAACVPGIRAEMAIPLIHREHLIGAINLETTKPKQFTRESFDFLSMIASHVTVAIDNAQLYQVSQQQLDEMHQLYMRISELEQLKTDMIRIAAHDLRNPLGIVKGYTALLIEDRDTLSSEQFSFVQAIDEAGEKMLKIIRDILSLQRIEAMQNKANCDEIDLADMVRELAGGHSVRSRQKAQTYQMIVPDTPVSICVDQGQVREAVDNLIGNAVKYTPNGGSVTVELTTAGDRAVFQVRDTGLGIAEEEQARLFQPFFRASNAKASDIEGTGLGLHLVKNIIERHGGKMRFQSALGKGSTFGFELPMQREAVSG